MTTTAPPKPADSARNGDPPSGAWKPELHEIPIKAIDVGANVRSAEALDVVELAASIRTHGVISPVRLADVGGGRYELVYGQRRLAAAKVAGLTTIPAIVDAEQLNAAARTVEQLIENLQREDLNPIDTATAYRALLDTGMSQRELGVQLGIAQPTIANTLRLLKAPEAIRERVSAGELTATHAQAIAKLPSVEQTEIARRIVEHGLSTRDVEAEIATAERRATEEQSRDEQRKNRAAARLQTVIDLLAKKKTDQAAVTLVGFTGTAGDALEQLKALGWKTKIDVNYATPVKGICDCTALRLSFDYSWLGGQQVEKATLAKTCISSKHQAAANKAYRETQEQEQRERQEAAAKAQAERDAELAPLAAAVTMAIPPVKAKLLLYAMVDVGHNGYWQAGELAERLGVKLGYDTWREQLWTAIDALDHERLLAEIAHRVAEVIQDAGEKHPMRAVVAGLADDDHDNVVENLKPKRVAKGGAK